MTKTWAGWWWLGLGMLACRSGDEGPKAGEPDPTTPDPTVAGAECGGADYPCSIAEMDPAVAAQLDALAAEAGEALRAGASGNDLLEGLLRDQGAIEGAAADDSLWFRLPGSVPAWVLGAEAAREDQVEGARNAALWSVVGGAGNPLKAARVVSPFAWDFQTYDDSVWLADVVRSVPDYGYIDEHINQDAAAASWSATDAFSQLNLDDLIHVATHGDTLCDGGICRTVLGTGAVSSTANPSLPEVAFYVRETRYVGMVSSVLLADVEPGTVLFLNGCKSYQDSLATKLGPDGALLGWDNYVTNQAAKLTGEAFYVGTMDQGRRVGDVYANLERLGFTTSSRFNKETGATEPVRFKSSHTLPGTGPRLRDIVELRDPSGKRLVDGSVLNVTTEQGDGEPDELELDLRVFGLEPNELNREVRIRLDEVDTAVMPVATGAAVSTYVRDLSDEITLPIDTEPDRDYVLEAIIPLPEGGESKHTVKVRFISSPTLVFTYSLITSTAGLPDRLNVVEGRIPLRWDAALDTYTGAGEVEVTYHDPFLEEPDEGCTVAVSHTPGTFDVFSLEVPGGELKPGRVPTRLEFLIGPFISTTTLQCGPLNFPFPDALAWGQFNVHRLDDGSLEEGAGFIVADQFVAGDDKVVGVHTYAVDTVDGDTSWAELTTLSVELP
jgi:hypothetical protein